MNNKFIYLLIFISGMSIMGIEMTASRLLAPYFGSSIFVWSALIGSVMLFLSLGYYFGGKMADRYPHIWVVYSITLTAGIITGMVPFIAKPILMFSINTFESNSYFSLIGAITASLILISLPITLLAMVSPFVIRIILLNTADAGYISGKIFTVSTIGSLAGTFLPVIFLIPNIGTQKTFVLFAILLTIVSSTGLFLYKKNILIFLLSVFVIMLFFVPKGKIKNIKGTLYEGESNYNFINVLKNSNGTFELRLEEGYGIHSRYNPGQILYNDVWSYYIFSPFFSRLNLSSENPNKTKESALIIGLGAGTIAKIYNRYFPSIALDGVEIDPLIVEAGKKFFDMKENELNIFIDDGRFFMRKNNNRRYDIIMMDAYRLPYIPFHLTTKEFFGEVNNKLKPNGIFVINIGKTIDDYRLVDAVCKTLKNVFPQVFVFDIPGYSMNTLTFAAREKIDIENLKKNILLNHDPESENIAKTFLDELKEYKNETDIDILTDDCAPVEKIIDSIVIDYVLMQLKNNRS